MRIPNRAAPAPTVPVFALPGEKTIPVFGRWFGSWKFSVERRALSPAELIRSYDRAAPDWARTLDRLGMGHAYDGLFEGSGNAFLRTPMRTGNAHPLRVLDCGIGTGALSAAFARRHPDGLALDAVDLSPRMLTLAGKTLRKAGLDATLREADIRNLPYDDDIFDLVMAGHVLEHLADPAPALREMERVLRPGGAMLLCITRRSALGLYVHLKWRTHRVTHSEAEGWLNDLGLTSVRSVRLGGSVFARHLSIAVMGRKPRKAV